MIWIVGEYAQKIENAVELIEYFFENFKFESSQVQLQLLTATVKCFLKRPQQGQEVVQRVLQTATTTGESSDLRDKAYIYWRLLSTDPQAAKAVVLAERPPIAAEMPTVSQSLLNDLIRQINTLASVYHKPSEAFLTTKVFTRKAKAADSDDEGDGGVPVSSGVGDLLDLGLGSEPGAAVISPNMTGVVDAGVPPGIDLLSVDMPAVPVSPPVAASGPAPVQQLANESLILPKQTVFTAANSKGLEVQAAFVRKQGQIHLMLSLHNKALTAMTDFGLQFNKNSFALVPGAPLTLPHPLPANQSHDISIPLLHAGQTQKSNPVNLLQVAIKNNFDVFYGQMLVPLHVLLVETGGSISSGDFQSVFTDASAPGEKFVVSSGATLQAVRDQLQRNHVFVVHATGPTVSYVLYPFFIFFYLQISRLFTLPVRWLMA